MHDEPTHDEPTLCRVEASEYARLRRVDNAARAFFVAQLRGDAREAHRRRDDLIDALDESDA